MSLLPDTTHWIRWLAAGTLPAFEAPTNGRSVWLSTIAVMELWAGVRNEHEARDLTSLTQAARRRQRLLNPSPSAWVLCGQAVAALRDAGLGSARLRAIRHDVLLAATASLMNAKVLTANRRDFAAIARVIPLRWST